MEYRIFSNHPSKGYTVQFKNGQSFHARDVHAAMDKAGEVLQEVQSKGR